MERKATWQVTDQHGRAWSALFRLKNKPFPAPVSPYRPVGWMAPLPELLPPQQYFRPVRGNRVLINYEAWRQDLQTAFQERTAAGKQAAREMFGSKAGDAWKQRDPEVIAEVGSLPLNPTFVDAMEAGEKWVLGIPRNDGSLRPVPAWAEPLIKDLKSYQKAEAAKARRSSFTLVEDDDVEVPEGEFVPRRYREVDEWDTKAESAKIAERLARAEQYADTEETYDPEAVGGRRKRPGRPRRASSEVNE
jgi:hypothetical protein